jgi:glycosyltransferase involved in cell wall biosynthesis
MRSVRVAVVTTPLTVPPRDGVSAFAKSALGAINDAGHQVILVVFDDGHASAIDQMHAAYDMCEIVVVPLRLRSSSIAHRLGRRLLSALMLVPPAQVPYVASLPLMKRQLAELAADVVVAFGNSPGLAIGDSVRCGAVLQFSLPEVDVTLGGNGRWRQLLAAMWQRRLARSARVLLATTSTDVAAISARFPRAEVRMIPFAVKPNLRLRPGRSPRLLFVGDFNYEPNAAAARELSSRVLPEFFLAVPDAEVLIAGKASDALQIGGLDPRVRLIGQYEAIEDFATERTVGILPLVAAGGVRTRVFEYAAAGIPLVATHASVAGLPPEALGGVVVTDQADLAAVCSRLFRAHEELDRLREAGLVSLSKAANGADAIKAWTDVVASLDERGPGRPRVASAKDKARRM